MPEIETEIPTGEMRHREITLADGRYLIFYNFADEPSATDDERNEQREDV